MRDVDDESAARHARTGRASSLARVPSPYVGVVCVVSAREACLFLTSQPPPHSGRAAQGPHTAPLTASSTARAAGTRHVPRRSTRWSLIDKHKESTSSTSSSGHMHCERDARARSAKRGSTWRRAPCAHLAQLANEHDLVQANVEEAHRGAAPLAVERQRRHDRRRGRRRRVDCHCV